jgi:hypothetical protein
MMFRISLRFASFPWAPLSTANRVTFLFISVTLQSKLLLNQLFTQLPKSRCKLHIFSMWCSIAHLAVMQQHTLPRTCNQISIIIQHFSTSSITLTTQSRIQRSNQHRRSTLIMILPKRTRLQNRRFTVFIEITT